ncbi:hypothetical protein K439DRAFT_1357325, partial [Ramaria rubella]
MLQPPPSTPAKPDTSSHSTPNTDTLASKLESLHEIIHKIALPKTKTAKTCTIAMNTLHAACNLITSACENIKESYFDSRISNIFENLESISAHIGLATPSNQACSYVSVLVNATMPPSTPSKPPKPHCDNIFDLTFAQSNRNTPFFTNISDSDLLAKVNKVLIDTQCSYNTEVYPHDSNGYVCKEHSAIHILAVGRHCSGNIWISTCAKDEQDHLIKTTHCWLPNLSSSLHITPQTYPILVHGIPTSFETSRDSDDIVTLLDENCHLIHPSMLSSTLQCSHPPFNALIHPSMLQNVEFISHSPQSVKKAHSSLLLYLTSPNAANDCIKRHITFNRCLHTTVKFIRYPLQCYNCYCFGHFTRSCKSTTT